MNTGHHTHGFIRNCRPVLIGIAALGLILNACGIGERKSITVGILCELSYLETVVDGFRAGMADFGYEEGRNVTYLYGGLTGSEAGVIDAEVERILNRKVDLLFTTGNMATRRASIAISGTDIPLVFGAAANPVGEKLVESLSRPGGNLTGVQVGVEVPNGQRRSGDGGHQTKAALGGRASPDG